MDVCGLGRDRKKVSWDPPRWSWGGAVPTWACAPRALAAQAGAWAPVALSHAVKVLVRGGGSFRRRRRGLVPAGLRRRWRWERRRWWSGRTTVGRGLRPTNVSHVHYHGLVHSPCLLRFRRLRRPRLRTFYHVRAHVRSLHATDVWVVAHLARGSPMLFNRDQPAAPFAFFKRRSD